MVIQVLHVHTVIPELVISIRLYLFDELLDRISRLSQVEKNVGFVHSVRSAI